MSENGSTQDFENLRQSQEAASIANRLEKMLEEVAGERAQKRKAQQELQSSIKSKVDELKAELDRIINSRSVQDQNQGNAYQQENQGDLKSAHPSPNDSAGANSQVIQQTNLRSLEPEQAFEDKVVSQGVATYQEQRTQVTQIEGSAVKSDDFDDLLADEFGVYIEKQGPGPVVEVPKVSPTHPIAPPGPAHRQPPGPVWPPPQPSAQDSAKDNSSISFAEEFSYLNEQSSHNLEAKKTQSKPEPPAFRSQSFGFKPKGKKRK